MCTMEDGRKIHVSNINYKVSGGQLKAFMLKFGAIKSLYIVRDNNGRSKGFGFVTFKENRSADNALKAIKEDLVLEKRSLRLNHCHSSKKKPSKSLPEKHPLSSSVTVATSDTRQHKPPSATTCSTICSVFLPDDVLLLIFSCLNLFDLFKVELVCQRWYGLAQTGWKCKRSLQFQNFYKGFGSFFSVQDRIFVKILEKTCGNLQCLDMSASSLLCTDYTYDRIGILCPRLHTLNLSNCMISDNSSRFLSSKLASLKTLTLISCSISEKSFWWFLHNSPDLEYLDVQENHKITGKCFSVSSGKLKTVNMSYCCKIEIESLKLLAKANNDLEVLKINNCAKLSLDCLTPVSKSCEKLKVLEIGENTYFLDIDVPPSKLSCCHLSNLQVIVLDNRKEVDDETLVAIGQHCRILREISLQKCNNVTDKGFCALCQSVPSLTDVHISFCSQISDYSILKLSSCCTSLTRLIAKGCHKVSNESIINLIKSCSRLVKIDLSGCLNINDKLLLHLIDINETTKLNNLQLFLGGTKVTPSSADMLSEFCKINICQQYDCDCDNCMDLEEEFVDYSFSDCDLSLDDGDYGDDYYYDYLIGLNPALLSDESFDYDDDDVYDDYYY